MASLARICDGATEAPESKTSPCDTRMICVGASKRFSRSGQGDPAALLARCGLLTNRFGSRSRGSLARRVARGIPLRSCRFCPPVVFACIAAMLVRGNLLLCMCCVPVHAHYGTDSIVDVLFRRGMHAARVRPKLG